MDSSKHFLMEIEIKEFRISHSDKCDTRGKWPLASNLVTPH